MNEDHCQQYEVPLKSHLLGVCQIPPLCPAVVEVVVGVDGDGEVVSDVQDSPVL